MLLSDGSPFTTSITPLPIQPSNPSHPTYCSWHTLSLTHMHKNSNKYTVHSTHTHTHSGESLFSVSKGLNQLQPQQKQSCIFSMLFSVNTRLCSFKCFKTAKTLILAFTTTRFNEVFKIFLMQNIRLCHISEG